MLLTLKEVKITTLVIKVKLTSITKTKQNKSKKNIIQGSDIFVSGAH